MSTSTSTPASASTPLRKDQDGVYTDPGAALEAVQAVLAEARDWGLLGVDLEWDQERHITWIGLGTARWAVSFYRQTLPEQALVLIRDAMADETLPKLGHNGIQADKSVWEAEVGPVNGEVEDSMLAHHAAYPGIAHDLQQVVSQFLVVPPWKAWRRDQQKQAKQQVKAQVMLDKKAVKQAGHAARNAERAAEKAAKQAEKQAAHAAKHCAQVAERERKKTDKQAAHEARNAAAAQAREDRKAAKRAATQTQLAAVQATQPVGPQIRRKVIAPPPPPPPSNDNDSDEDSSCCVCGDHTLPAFQGPDKKWRCEQHADEVPHA